MTAFHTQVKLYKFDHKDFQFTANLNSAITVADVGKALSQDTSADNTVKLAADAEEIVGILYTFENRLNEAHNVGTVEMKFSAQLPIKSGLAGAQIVARGSRLCGAGSGEVRAIDPAVDTTLLRFFGTSPRVWAVSGLKAAAQKL